MFRTNQIYSVANKDVIIQRINKNLFSVTWYSRTSNALKSQLIRNKDLKEHGLLNTLFLRADTLLKGCTNKYYTAQELLELSQGKWSVN